MIRLINEVIDRRLQLNIELRTIQLSSVLMRRLTSEMNLNIPTNNQIKYDAEQMEFTYKYQDKIWTIRNRNYRDDTNDSDVEEIMCNLIQQIK